MTTATPAIGLMLGGAVVLWLCFRWRRTGSIEASSRSLIRRSCSTDLPSERTSFFLPCLLQVGLFFAVPLFLSVSARSVSDRAGVRLLPLSITLLPAAAGIPKVFPNASPRRVVRIGLLALFAGIVVMVGRSTRARTGNRHLADAA